LELGPRYGGQLEVVPEDGHRRLDAGAIAYKDEAGQVPPRVRGELAGRDAVAPKDLCVEVMHREAHSNLEHDIVDADGALRRRLAGRPAVFGAKRPVLLLADAVLAAHVEEDLLAK